MLQQPFIRSESTGGTLRTEDKTYPPSMSDDEHLIRLAFAQDPVTGCELLFRRYYAPLRNHAVRFVYSSVLRELNGEKKAAPMA